MDTKCVCNICGQTKMVWFADCFLSGWPRCCDKRMVVKETSADVEELIDQAFMAVDVMIERMVHGT